MNPSDALQNGSFKHEKRKFGQSQICNLRTTHSSVLKSSVLKLGLTTAKNEKKKKEKKRKKERLFS